MAAEADGAVGRHLLRMGQRAAGLLARLEGWMAHNNAVIMAVLLLVIGAKLIGDAISGFAT